MSLVIRQSIQTSIISYAGVVIGYINLLYLYPKFLELDQVGLLRVIQDAAMLMAPFATIGMAQGVLRFFPQFSQSQAKTNSFAGLITLMALGGFTVFLLVFLVFESSIVSFFEDKAKTIIQHKDLILLLTLCLVLIAIFEQFSKALLRVAFPNFLREILIRTMQGVIVILYFYAILTYDQFITWSVYIYFISLLILVVALYRWKISLSFKNLSGFPVRTIVKYSSISFVSASAMILIGKMDSIMVTGYLGLESVAIYTNAYYMATVIDIPKRAITQTSTTLLARAFERKDMLQVAALYHKTSLNQFIIGALLLIGVWANLESFFQLMPKGDIYRAGSLVVIIVGLGKLIDMLFGPSSEMIGLSRYYWFNLVVITLLAAIVVVMNYLLIPRIGIEGAAYGAVVAVIFYNVIKFIFIAVKLKIQPFSLATIKVLFIAMVTAGLNLILPSLDNVFADMFYRSFLITAVYGALILWTRSSEDINNLVARVLQRVSGKGRGQ